MQRIILDTNVVVSALISNSVPTQILNELILPQKVKLCLSDQVYLEYTDVLGREKFSRFSDFKRKSEVVLNALRGVALFFKPQEEINILSDLGDNKFLELAAVSNAHYLTTGNIRDFTIVKFRNTRIVTPREYWEQFAPV